MVGLVIDVLLSIAVEEGTYGVTFIGALVGPAVGAFVGIWLSRDDHDR